MAARPGFEPYIAEKGFFKAITSLLRTHEFGGFSIRYGENHGKQVVHKTLSGKHR